MERLLRTLASDDFSARENRDTSAVALGCDSRRCALLREAIDKHSPELADDFEARELLAELRQALPPSDQSQRPLRC